MREIRFRAMIWNKFVYFTLKDISEWGPSWDGPVFDEYSNWEQFTGWRDKNGREIYEGDIVKFDVVASERGPEKFGQTGIVQDVPRYGWGIGGYSPAWIKNEDVIGNIHENPELLNEAV